MRTNKIYSEDDFHNNVSAEDDILLAQQLLNSNFSDFDKTILLWQYYTNRISVEELANKVSVTFN